MKKSKAFKVESGIADAFEAYCESKSLIQGDVLSAMMISVTKMSAEEKDSLIDGLNKWREKTIPAEKSSSKVLSARGALVADAVSRGRKHRKSDVG